MLWILRNRLNIESRGKRRTKSRRKGERRLYEETKSLCRAAKKSVRVGGSNCMNAEVEKNGTDFHHKADADFLLY